VNPWLNVDCSPAKTRSITTQKIDIKHSGGGGGSSSSNNNNHHHSIRLQGIAPIVQAEINPQYVSQYKYKRKNLLHFLFIDPLTLFDEFNLIIDYLEQ